MAKVLEGLAATKELLFALVAVIYLLWERVRRLREREEQAELWVQKEHLDDLLSQTLEIEAKQIGLRDPKELSALLEKATRVKLQALEELTHEELRGDRSFLIFLTQSSNLISRMADQAGGPRRRGSECAGSGSGLGQRADGGLGGAGTLPDLGSPGAGRRTDHAAAATSTNSKIWRSFVMTASGGRRSLWSSRRRRERSSPAKRAVRKPSWAAGWMSFRASLPM